jgi:FkbM family methyltransferase
MPQAVKKRLLQRYYLRRLKQYRAAGDWASRESDMAIVRNLVRAGDSVVDLGANFGFYTAFLSELVGPGGHVNSFEPIPRTFDMLAYSVKRLSLSNVRLFNCAISDQDCEATMVVPKFHESGSDNYYQARLMPNALDDDSTRQHVDVRVAKLDSVLKVGSSGITFMKVDVEGHESQAVAGAIDLISINKPSLLIEISGNLDDEQSTAFALIKRLQDTGYAPYWYDGTRLRRRSQGDESINYFFLTEAHRRHLIEVANCQID